MFPVPDHGGRGVIAGALSGRWGEYQEGPAITSKAPFSKRFAEAAGLACESAAARRVARSSDWRQLRCGPSIYNIWNARRRREESRCCGRTEIFRFWLGGLPVPGRKLTKSNYPAAKASFYLTAVINVHPVPKVIQEETHSVIGCCQPFLHPNASAVDTDKSE